MEFLLVLLVILVFTRIMGELLSRFNQPELVGNLVAGIILGALIQQYGDFLPGFSGITEDHGFIAITELGVFFLMLRAGLEMQPKELIRSSGRSMVIALGGLLLPFISGVGLGMYYLPESNWKLAQVMFIGTALAITAIPVAAKILMDLGELRSRLGKTIISAALFDDVFGLVLLAILTALINTGEALTASGLLLLGGRVAVFFLAISIIGYYLLPWLLSKLEFLLTEEVEFSMLLVVGLGFSLIAELLELHFILGAFMAGLMFTKRNFGRKIYEDVSNKVNAISNGFLAPIFFGSIGLHLDLSALTTIPMFVLILILLAMLSKFIGAGAAALAMGMKKDEAASIGVGMSARGAVELIIAEIALTAGLFSVPDPTPEIINYLYSAIVIMAITTTLLMPIGFRYFLNRTSGPDQ